MSQKQLRDPQLFVKNILKSDPHIKKYFWYNISNLDQNLSIQSGLIHAYEYKKGHSNVNKCSYYVVKHT
jgi:hypothetical protein